MYYLLEDNRIVDSKNIRNDLDLSFEIDVFVRDNKIFMGSYDYPGFEKTIKIKKQSENVYDFIDWGQDLVRVDDNIFCCKYFYSKEEYLNNKWFNAIYKPNSKGDYIKVWEEK